MGAKTPAGGVLSKSPDLDRVWKLRLSAARPIVVEAVHIGNLSKKIRRRGRADDPHKRGAGYVSRPATENASPGSGVAGPGRDGSWAHPSGAPNDRAAQPVGIMVGGTTEIFLRKERF